MNKKLFPAFLIAAVILLAILYGLATGGLTGGHGFKVDRLVAKNIDAKGGASEWATINTLRLSGLLDLGQGVHVRYVMEQKRPDKMCLQYEYGERPAVQCVNGHSGWNFLPFLGHRKPQAMSADEVIAMTDTASIDGLLFNSANRNFKVEHLGQEDLQGRLTKKLKVTMPGGTERWIYLDEETGLEIKLASTRQLRGKQRQVETTFSNWIEQDGLLFPGRQDTRTVGQSESRFITIDTIEVNPVIDDERFANRAVN